MKQKRVTVLGLGYVGQALLTALLESKQFVVYGLDKNPEVVKKITTALPQNLRQKVTLTTDPEAVLPETDIVVICVPTPVNTRKKPDFTALKKSAESIEKYLFQGQLVIIESSVHPGVCEDIVLPILESSGLRLGKDFELSHCPERINVGDPTWSIKNIPRNIGSLTKNGLKQTAAFYRSFLSGKIYEMDTIKEAESTKIVENTFRDINIAFVNELAMSLDRLGINAVKVIEGAANKPFSFLAHYPGCGVGGDCIATDPYYYIEMLRPLGMVPKLAQTARALNSNMPKYLVRKATQALNQRKIDIKKLRVTVLGLAYKPEIDDVRHSPGMDVVKQFKNDGIAPQTFDPFLPKLSTALSLEDALTSADIVILCTAHQVFMKNITPKLLKKYGVTAFVDGRNVFQRAEFEAAGIMYEGIGT
jgi:UDP-N-acetyl-D-glucosamine dehydrogenase